MGIGSKIKSAIANLFYTKETRENIRGEVEKIENGVRSTLPQKRVKKINWWLEHGRARRAILDQEGRRRGVARKYCLKYGPMDFVKNGLRRNFQEQYYLLIKFF